MCVGFVNSGIMKLEQTVGIIMGANIGTTITAQILRLSDISSDNLLLSLLNPENFGPLLVVAGILFYMFFKGGQKKTVGQVCLGLGLLFIGMTTMKVAVSPLQTVPEFQQMFVAFSNPVLGILVGALVTALLQSSTASVGILQALTSTGVITFNVALPIIMGQNIGTCITTLISSIGASRNAKRTAMIHLYFNILGTAFCLFAVYGARAIATAAAGGLSFWTATMNVGDIATIHTLFNIGCTVLLLPFHKLLVKLAKRTVPGDDTAEFNVLDERFLATPSIALEQARAAVVTMGRKAQEDFGMAVELLTSYDEKKLERLQENEATIDKLETMLDAYLVKLTDRALTDAESALVSELLHTLTNFERIGDYAVNVSESATHLRERDIAFSPEAKRELHYLTDAVAATLDTTLRCYEERDHALALHVEPLEEVVDLMQEVLKNRHVERLKAGSCTIELGTQFLELLINLERISDHCSNVAMLIVRTTTPPSEHLPDTHTYLKYLHSGGDREFDELFAEYRKEYFEPIA